MRYSGTHWKSLRHSDPELYDLCYWRAAKAYANEYEELEDSPAALEVVYGSRMSSLTLGLIDGEAVSLFGWGYCGYLALELHRLTGFPLALFTANENEIGWSGHAAVALPDGNFLDIEGVATATDINSRYCFESPILASFPERDAYCETMFRGNGSGAQNPYADLDPLEIRLLQHFAALTVEQSS